MKLNNCKTNVITTEYEQLTIHEMDISLMIKIKSHLIIFRSLS